MRTIRAKVIFLLILVFFAFSALELSVQNHIVFPSFLEIEKENAVKDARRLKKSISREIYHLDNLCHDWAAWDETYDYAADPTAAYIERNVPESAFPDNRLNYICFVGQDKTVLWSQGYDLVQKTRMKIYGLPDDRFPDTHILVSYPLGRFPLSGVFVRGILMTGSGPMLVASRPILTNSNQGPIRGSVIMGRLLNNTMVAAIKEQTRVDFNLFPIFSQSVPAAIRQVLLQLSEEKPFFTRARGDKILQVFATLSDVNNKPALLLEVDSPREISAGGMKALRITLFVKIASSILIVLFLLFMLQQAVFRKIRKLTDHIQLVQKTEDLTQRIDVVQRDEVGILAGGFNALLDQLNENIRRSKQYEEDLQTSERRFRTIVKNTPAVFFILDLDGTILLFEGKALKKLKIQPEQMVGHSALKLFYDYPDTIRDIRRGLAGEGFTVDTRIQDFIFETTYHPYTDQSGELAGTIGIATDITELRRYIEVLRENEEQYRSIVENSHDGIILIGTDYRFQYVNDEFCRITGRNAAELLGQDFRTVLDDDSIDLVTERYEKRQRGEYVPARYEFNVLRKNGQKRRVEFSGNVITDSNGVSRTVGQLLDVTRNKEAEEERRRLEMKLRQAQKMEAIGTLAGGIAHDFNNILSAIMGYAQLASMNSEGNEKVQKHLQQLTASSERAKSLVQQILAFSRQTQVEKIPVDIGMVFKEVLKLVRPTIPATIDIQHNVVSNLGAVMADQTQIHQVLMNLCVNASQAMEEDGGVLRVDLEPVELTARDVEAYHDIEPGNYLKLTVSDTGIGMDSKTMSHIFEPYFTTKKVAEGTGMGLATVHGIVTDCGGDIKVTSQPGVGTTFHVLFPVIEKEIEEVETSILDLPTGSEQVLFVDDEKFLVDIGIEMLNDLGYRVEGRTSSYDALEAFRANPDKYDIVITDMTMPEMTGEKLAMEIKNIRADIPVIICSGFSKAMTQERANRIGVKSFLNKPITMEEMAYAIRRELDEA